MKAVRAGFHDWHEMKEQIVKLFSFLVGKARRTRAVGREESAAIFLSLLHKGMNGGITIGCG